MEPAYRRDRAAVAAICASLLAAGAFEAPTVLATQDRTVWAASPWRDDPYHAVLGLAELAVPALGLLIVLRLFGWRAPGRSDRGQQTVRAAGTMTALAGAALAFEWAAVLAGAHAAARTGWTSLLIAGLVVTSLLTAAAGVLLARCRWPRGSARRWRHDWLGDAALLCRWTPLPRRWIGPAAVAAVRRHALTGFVAASALAAAGVAGAQAIGEQLTDPLLVAWYFVVEATSLIAFCLVSNAIAGFVVRPARGRVRRAAEAALVTGGLATILAVAFRDVARAALGAGPVASVPTLVGLTLGVGLGVAVLTTAVLLVRTQDSSERATG
ncbi:hypothetical protein [Actinocatenispora thailandica]|nr:hypothetical protein [Actinocatenispora thailandica]